MLREQGQVLRAAVLGSPVAHSLSPVLHAAGYAAAGLTGWEYTRAEVDRAGLAPFVAGLGDEFRGLSLTMPLKEVALDLAGERSDLARRAGAANTLVRGQDGGWVAENTDVVGVAAALRPALSASPPHAVVLGSGATARSALLALADLGAASVTVRARNRDAVARLLAWARRVDLAVPDLASGPLAAWEATRGEVVVSTLPPAGAAAVAELPPACRGGTLLDVGYADWPTPLARTASARGWVVVPGLDMLVHQAAAQFELFTGVTAPLQAMLAAGRAAAGLT